MASYILTDVDDVLLRWLEGFVNFLIDERDVQLPRLHNSHEPNKWDMVPWLHDHGLDWDEETLMKHIEEFAHSESYKKIPAYSDARMYLPLIKSLEFGYDKVIAITNCSDDPHVKQSRIENLQLHFGDIIDDVIALPIKEPKKDALKKFKEEECIWIEDKYVHGKAGHDLGLYTYMLKRKHNKSACTPASPLHWVDDWSDIYYYEVEMWTGMKKSEILEKYNKVDNIDWKKVFADYK